MPIRVDLVEFDGSRTPLPRIVGEAIAFLFTFVIVVLLVTMAS
jgi:tetrahydromethanopterin S-methyltransferase subunit F